MADKDHGRILSDIKKTVALLSCPSSFFLRSDKLYENLYNQYFRSKYGLDPEFQLCLPSENVPPRQFSSYSSNSISELYYLIAQWHNEAKQHVLRMNENEKNVIFNSIGIQSYSSEKTNLINSYFTENQLKDEQNSNISSPSNSNLSYSSEMESLSKANRNKTLSSSNTKKHKSLGLAKTGRMIKSQRTGSYLHASSWSKRYYRTKSMHKRTELLKHALVNQKRQKITHSFSPSPSLLQRQQRHKPQFNENVGDQKHEKEKKELDDDEDEDEEDPLTILIRKQQQAFSARVAAGRPSARAKNMTDIDKSSNNLHTGITIINVPKVLPKVLRAWKSLAKKVVCKTARQRISNRRDKLIMAKRAARECARLLRQRALVSQKSAKDSISRGRRLTREIASNWRQSAANLSNGSGPLTINGVTVPTTTGAALKYCNLIDLPEYYSADGTNLEFSSGIGSMLESSATARRRAEKAAAEQRRADLELLEARRQQRKLNFLITQTELYAHFMARKMADVTNNDDPNYSNSVSTEISMDNDEYETKRILRRLEETEIDNNMNTKLSNDENEEIELGSINQTTTTATITTTTTTANSNNQLTETLKQKSFSSIAEAAKAAANRLGINMEDEYDIEQVKSEALLKVKAAVEKERSRTSQFKSKPMPINHSESLNKNKYEQLSNYDDESNNTNINATNNSITIKTQFEAPKLFKGQLKAYQIRGLNWLLGLFDQGINGILADEMGLGKTIQTIAFFGCLAENYNIWGPFLIVTPASTLHNWTQEFNKFLPSFRLVPYWGTPAERKVLRRFWSNPLSRSSFNNDHNSDAVSLSDNSMSNLSNEAGVKESEFHVVITSYQVVLQDAKFINKTAWSYIVLDEAHAIKSTSSLRWQILLSFKCRNRLLLTGTPIQNTMQELWALLHFIMPTLFDSHDEFANWFSRDIESQASATAGTGGGGGGTLITSKLNENQLSRLHLILKPFMLRRTKTEVEHEISTKTEIMLYCPLSRRQQLLYERLRNKICLEDISSMINTNSSDLFIQSSTSSSSLSDNNTISNNLNTNLTNNNVNYFQSNSSTTAHLINLVMQLRKICNHPDLWERRDVRFTCISGSICPNRNENYLTNENLSYGNTSWHLPKLFYNEDTLSEWSWKRNGFVNGPAGTNLCSWPLQLNGFNADILVSIARLFCLFHPAHVHEDLWHHDVDEPDLGPDGCDIFIRKKFVNVRKCFSFSRLLNLSVGELCQASLTYGLSLIIPQQFNHDWIKQNDLLTMKEIFHHDLITNTNLNNKINYFHTVKSYLISSLELLGISNLLNHQSKLCNQFYVPSMYSFNPGTRLYLPNYLTHATTAKVLLPPINFYVNVPNFQSCHHRHRILSTNLSVYVDSEQIGLDFLKSLRMQLIEPSHLELVSLATRIADSGKLTTLDHLLTKLKSGGHRVLIYSQMTRMIDILEEFMLYRKHAYLRLDGSSRLSDRRDMVAQWQTNPRWFVFLLSTRAGGLGINLTAADTVIFYDSDWNPTVDQQAMDRAHRLGQTKPVTVYRLICKNTVEGRMLQRAEEKRAMQHMVIQSSQEGLGNLLSDMNKKSEHWTSSEVVSLLLDDDELVKRLQIRRRLQPQRGRPPKNQTNNRLVSSVTTTKSLSNPLNNSPVSNNDGISEQCSTNNDNNNIQNMRTLESMSFDGDVLDRKRQAAWAEQTRIGRPKKKVRPIESIGPNPSYPTND